MSQVHQKRQLASYEQLVERNQQLEDQIATLRLQLRFQRGILSRPSLQGNIKAVLIASEQAIRKSVEKGDSQRDGMQRVYRSDVALLAGCSVQTVSDCWGKLVAGGLLKRFSETIYHEGNGEFERAVYLALPSEVWTNPNGVVLVKAPKVKKIKMCGHCHSTEIEILKYSVCKDCGARLKKNDILRVSPELLDIDPFEE